MSVGERTGSKRLAILDAKYRNLERAEFIICPYCGRHSHKKVFNSTSGYHEFKHWDRKTKRSVWCLGPPDEAA